MDESKLEDNKKTEDNDSFYIGNYIIVIIICFSNVLLVAPNSLEDFESFLGNFLGALVLPAIFAGIYYLFKRNGFGKAYVWFSLIFLLISILSK
tara:strand:+ start:505 stop:786 length:282 start_codon:yes stop_codon:yes gene_type:complete